MAANGSRVTQPKKLNGEFFEQMRHLMQESGTPDKMSRDALWAGLSVTYQTVEKMIEAQSESRQDRIDIRRYLRVLGVFTAILVLGHLSQVAQAADALWKWLLAFI